nr:hypothetical protein [Tanacetum cinerariifolium]
MANGLSFPLFLGSFLDQSVELLQLRSSTQVIDIFGHKVPRTTDMMKLVVEIECFGMTADEVDKETGSSDGLQPKQADLSCVHALNEPHLHKIHVVPVTPPNLVGSGILNI